MYRGFDGFGVVSFEPFVGSEPGVSVIGVLVERYPRFTMIAGDVETVVTSQLLRIDVELDDAAGSLTFFPYQVDHLTGKLRITDERVDIINAAIKQDGASLVVDGVVRFEKGRRLELEP